MESLADLLFNRFPENPGEEDAAGFKAAELVFQTPGGREKKESVSWEKHQDTDSTIRLL